MYSWSEQQRYCIEKMGFTLLSTWLPKKSSSTETVAGSSAENSLASTERLSTRDVKATNKPYKSLHQKLLQHDAERAQQKHDPAETNTQTLRGGEKPTTRPAQETIKQINHATSNSEVVSVSYYSLPTLTRTGKIYLLGSSATVDKLFGKQLIQDISLYLHRDKNFFQYIPLTVDTLDQAFEKLLQERHSTDQTVHNTNDNDHTHSLLIIVQSDKQTQQLQQITQENTLYGELQKKGVLQILPSLATLISDPIVKRSLLETLKQYKTA